MSPPNYVFVPSGRGFENQSQRLCPSISPVSFQHKSANLQKRRFVGGFPRTWAYNRQEQLETPRLGFYEKLSRHCICGNIRWS